ncbi:hypothetical protein SAMN02910413_1256 [Pseudobutyrivibrio sp. C4]|uniref:hypothetical protein n=1 Tax=Pseudobutyrivibrio sp. C4 TaxID=1520803 RepID=UPI0008C38F95|nr:hypothetical protein [Pseudobutyrivibrio sp. C4]SES92005.1 hypothetical protein SAMN02910413_1256 [Pseudobutyrivibrio sp. C4]
MAAKKETSTGTYDPNTEVVRKKYDSENVNRREYTQGKGTYDPEYYQRHKEYFSSMHERYYKETYKRVPFDVPRDWYNTLTDVIDSLDEKSSVNGFIKNAVEFYVANELSDKRFEEYHIKKALIKANGLVCSKCNKEVESIDKLSLNKDGTALLCSDCLK